MFKNNLLTLLSSSTEIVHSSDNVPNRSWEIISGLINDDWITNDETYIIKALTQ